MKDYSPQDYFKKLTLSQMRGLKFHPLADLFPLLDLVEVTELGRDIRKNGLKEPIVLHEGKILDGRNRYLACLQSGLGENKDWHPFVYLAAGGSVYAAMFDEDGKAPRPQEAATEEEAVSYVLTKNILRRHLKPDQRAAIAAKLYAKLEKPKPGGDRQSEKAKSGNTENALPSAKEQKKKVATQMDVSTDKLEMASAVGKADPAKLEEVAAGKKKLSQAEQEVKAKKQGKQTAPKPQAPAKVKTLELLAHKCRYQIIDPLPSWHVIRQAGLKDSHQHIVCTQCWTYSNVATVFGLTSKLNILQAAQPYRCSCECKDSERHATKEEIQKGGKG